MKKIMIMAALVMAIGLVSADLNSATAQCGTVFVGGGCHGGFYGGFYGGCHSGWVSPCFPAYRPCFPVYRPLGCGGYWSGGCFIRF